jgi:hypothetical protein
MVISLVVVVPGWLGRRRLTQQLGGVLVLLGLVLLGVMVTQTFTTWKRRYGEPTPDLVAKRMLFLVATRTEWPALPALVVGAGALVTTSWPRRLTASSSAQASLAGASPGASYDSSP